MAEWTDALGVIVQCNLSTCGRRAWLELADFPPDWTVRDFEQRLVCQDCGRTHFGVCVQVFRSVASRWPPPDDWRERCLADAERWKVYLRAHPYAHRRGTDEECS